MTAITLQNNITKKEPQKEQETKAHFLAAKIVAFAALLEGVVGIANFKNTGISCTKQVAGSIKALSTRVPLFFADLFGFIRFGKKYSWGARPLIVASHNYFWNRKDLANSAYNAYSLPLADALTTPLQKPMNWILNPIENGVVNVAKEIIPSSILSERSIRIAANQTKSQFLTYLRTLGVFMLATKVCNLKIDQPKPAFKTVYGLENLFWIGLTIGFYKAYDAVIDYLKEPVQIVTAAPTACVHEIEQRKTLAQKLQEKRAKQAQAN